MKVHMIFVILGAHVSRHLGIDKQLNPSGGPDRLLDDDDLEKLTSKLEYEALNTLCNALSVFGISR